MNDRTSARDARSGPSIVELVFAGEPRAEGRRRALAGLGVLALYATTLAIVSHVGHESPLNVARIEQAESERDVDLTPLPPAAASTSTRDTHPSRQLHVTRASGAAPSAPAQAAQLAATPADFTGLAFVTGSGATYAGGATTSHGTSRARALGSDGAGGGATMHSRARAVSLDGAAWSCPWPAEADAQQVNEQTVVLRVNVGADGRAQHVDVVSDPGFGFAAAARLCAATTRFEPARDPAGQPIAALSPPIRVHFSR